jgi:hypothetical protein
MQNNGWLKLDVFSFFGIIVAVVILSFTTNSGMSMSGHSGMQSTGMTMTGNGKDYAMVNTPMSNMQMQGGMGGSGGMGMMSNLGGMSGGSSGSMSGMSGSSGGSSGGGMMGMM